MDGLLECVVVQQSIFFAGLTLVTCVSFQLTLVTAAKGPSVKEEFGRRSWKNGRISERIAVVSGSRKRGGS